MLTHFPTLKRGANDHCASGAIEIGPMMVNKTDSCDCPDAHPLRSSCEGWKAGFSGDFFGSSA
jgi:hypothetical protein